MLTIQKTDVAVLGFLGHLGAIYLVKHTPLADDYAINISI
jgi:hypothetical protein